MRKWLIRMLERILLGLGWTPPVVQDEPLSMEKSVGKIVRKVTRLVAAFPDLDRAEVLKELERVIMEGRVSHGA